MSFDFGDFSAIHGVNTSTGGDTGSGTVNGTIEIQASTVVSGAQLVVTFESPVTAVGFDANNLADRRSEDLTFDNASADLVTITDPVDRVRFWGFRSDTPFTTLTFTLTLTSSPTGTDGFALDDVTYSAPVPVPALSGSALVLLALLSSGVAWQAVSMRPRELRIGQPSSCARTRIQS